MAISNAFCTSAKVEALLGQTNLNSSGGNTIKCALIKASPTGTYGAASTNYSNVTGNSDEVGNSGSYSAGGATLTKVTPTSSSTTAFADFDDFSFTSATISADGMIIYNSSNSNKAISTHDFGGTKSSSAGTFQVVFPTADASTAVLRLA